MAILISNRLHSNNGPQIPSREDANLLTDCPAIFLTSHSEIEKAKDRVRREQNLKSEKIRHCNKSVMMTNELSEAIDRSVIFQMRFVYSTDSCNDEELTSLFPLQTWPREGSEEESLQSQAVHRP